MLRTVKLKLLPTDAQLVLFENYIGASRFIWNYFLELQKGLYDAKMPYMSVTKMSAMLKELKLKYDWLTLISHHTLLGAIRDLNTAFQLFFKGHNGYPIFKAKHNMKQIFYARNDRFYVRDNQTVFFDKIGIVQYKANRRTLPQGTKQRVFKNVRVQKVKNSWYVLLAYECESQALETNGIMGIDVGIRTFVTAYKDNCVYTFDYITKKYKYLQLKRKQSYLQQQFWRKVRKHKTYKSKRQQYYFNILQKVNKRKAGLQRECLFTIVNSLIACRPSVIIVEHLDLEDMRENSNSYLRKQLAELPLYKFKRILKSKCDYYGIKLMEVPTHFPSSRKCSKCGYVYPTSIGVVEDYVCDCCGYTINRDVNAAINLSKAIDKAELLK